MSTNTQNQRHPRFRSRTQVLLASTGLLLLIAAAVLLILNSLGITPLPNTWSNALTIAFVTVGVIAAFGQWQLSLPPLPTTANEMLSGDGIQVSASKFDREQELEIFRQQIEHGLDKRLKRGVLIFHTDDDYVGQEVSIVPEISWIRHPSARDQLPDIQKRTIKRVKVNNGYICVAVHRNLDPDDYRAWIDINQSTSFPVFPNEATVVDLR